MFLRINFSVLIVSLFAIFSSPAQGAVVFAAGERFSSTFDFSAASAQPPYGSAIWEIRFDESDPLDVVGGEGLFIEIFDSSGLLVGSLNTIERFGPNPSPSLSLGFSTGPDLDELLNDAVGLVILSGLGQSTFTINSAFLSFGRAFPLSGQTNFINIADTLEPVTEIPLPAAMYVFIVGLAGLVGIRRRQKADT